MRGSGCWESYLAVDFFGSLWRFPSTERERDRERDLEDLPENREGDFLFCLVGLLRGDMEIAIASGSGCKGAAVTVEAITSSYGGSSGPSHCNAAVVVDGFKTEDSEEDVGGTGGPRGAVNMVEQGEGGRAKPCELRRLDGTGLAGKAMETDRREEASMTCGSLCVCSDISMGWWRVPFPLNVANIGAHKPQSSEQSSCFVFSNWTAVWRLEGSQVVF